MVTGYCHVQHQPALVPSLERLKIQKEQVRLPVDTKEQLTEAGTAASVFPVPAWGAISGASTLPALGWAPYVPCLTVYRRKVLLCTWTDGETEAWELNDPSKVPQPGWQGGDLKPRLILGLSPGAGAVSQAS